MKKIIQITSGKGPSECDWVVAQVVKKVIEEAKKEGLENTILEEEQGTENNTTASVIIEIKGEKVTEFIQTWVGTVQWVGESMFRKNHKRKNWFIGIFELEPLTEKNISEKDIVYEAMRASGAGGQHVNKVSSAIRATHTPTGVSVVVMDSRSQHQNKALATERLLAKFKEDTLQIMKAKIQSQWENQLQVERGNAIRTFKGINFK